MTYIQLHYILGCKKQIQFNLVFYLTSLKFNQCPECLTVILSNQAYFPKFIVLDEPRQTFCRLTFKTRCKRQKYLMDRLPLF